MGTLIDHLATDRLQGGKLVAAYTVGLLIGVGVALIALLATGSAA
jgi:hypothetical protein